METKSNNETTHRESVGYKATTLRFPVNKEYGTKIYFPADANWFKMNQTEETLEVLIEKNPSEKERKVLITCSCRGKGNINCYITQEKKTTFQIKSELYPKITGRVYDHFIKEYNANKYPSQWPTAIIVRVGKIIDAVGFQYGNQRIQLGGNGGVLKEFKLSPGEYITSVSGKYTRHYKRAMGVLIYNSITFHTNRGSYSVVGELLASSRSVSYTAAKDNAIFCLYGISNSNFVSALGFYETSIE